MKMEQKHIVYSILVFAVLLLIIYTVLVMMRKEKMSSTELFEYKPDIYSKQMYVNGIHSTGNVNKIYRQEDNKFHYIFTFDLPRLVNPKDRYTVFADNMNVGELEREMGTGLYVLKLVTDNDYKEFNIFFGDKKII